MLTNVSIERARKILLDRNIKPKITDMPILDSLDYILAEDIKSDTDMPPFDRSPLDGYAIRSEDTVGASEENPVTLETIDNIQAGYVSKKTIGSGQAIRIMTGAKIPEGADAIIKYEDTVFTEKDVKIFGGCKPNSNIVKAGEDILKGEVVLKKGKTISPADIGILATLGKERVKVYKRPKIAILATGDELVNINEPLREGKIRNSNSYTIGAQVKKIGSEVKIFDICCDNIESIKRELDLALEWGDIVITSGGVSVGDADVVKEAFKEVGGEILFWKVKMKPGSPIAVAKRGDKLLFGLSGNPAAAYITFEKFVRPTILKLSGETKYDFIKVKSILESGFTKVSRKNRIVRAKTYYKNGGFFTELPDKHGSGILSSLSETNSLFYIAPETGPYKPGDEIEVELLNYSEVYE
ncbi:MAG TPA: gephyrin-like molybdotransferase Glp [Oscillospiraceae bacterium]|nr:gephyrin-like molybdotransferase Glp [Oscillospiraceae bacterium]